MTIKTNVAADSYLITKDKKLIKVINTISYESKSDGILICNILKIVIHYFLNL